MTTPESFRVHRVTAAESFREKNMEPTHIFYKELPIDENNIFTTNIAERK